MAKRLQKTVGAVLALALILGASHEASAQADPQNYLFNSGQTIQPFFEGWAHNPDGSFEMHFGYLNRNYVEELHIPAGPGNRFESGGADQGQPTFFYPRVNHRVFSVTVPADFGDQELIWTVSVRDEAHQAIGWLQAEWEIDPVPARFLGEGQTANQAPTLVVDAASAIGLANPLTMMATVTDDGLPEPRRRRGGAPVVLPTFEPVGPSLPINVPQIQSENRHRPTRTRVREVNLIWTQWRGPTGVTLELQGEPVDDSATVTATFQSPGEYVFRVQASDGPSTVTQLVSVTVR